MKRRIRVEGRVQGVFYRGWTVETARGLGLDGWVRNRIDGSVEIVAAGLESAVEALIALCREGPPAARVARVEVDQTNEVLSGGFTQRPTA